MKYLFMSLLAGCTKSPLFHDWTKEPRCSTNQSYDLWSADGKTWHNHTVDNFKMRILVCYKDIVYTDEQQSGD